MAQSGIRLRRLAQAVDGSVTGEGDPMVTDVTHDSRTVDPGTMFVAVRGATIDGHRFAADAAAAGAVAVCVDHPLDLDVPQLVVESTRDVLGQLADIVHGSPSSAVKVIGVTGTNGKSTVTHYIESIASGAGLITGLIGTIETRIGHFEFHSSRTTPEASDFQRMLAAMRDRGADLVATEVSSHALALGRVRATRFAVAAFTNLSQDHLDFHETMASYRAAKASLFSDYDVGAAVINVDDPVGAEIASSFGGRLVTVGTEAMVRIGPIDTGQAASRFHMTSPWGESEVTAPVIGEFNVFNLVLAATCCLASGIDFSAVVAGMGAVSGVPGRFEVVSGDDEVLVVVDYAHTPEGIAKAVETARQLTNGRIVGLVGAGGDRDRHKRPAMGAAVSRADVSIITSDNPRSEDPAEIVGEIVSGVPDDATHMVEIDRRRAIRLAIAEAQPGDVVLIMGRGHEPNQEIGGRVVPFDDRIVAAEALASLRMADGEARPA